jgi:hypothetical protein
MNDDEELLVTFSGLEWLLEQITSNITNIDENETFKISCSLNVKDETYIISDLKAYK